MNTSECPGKIRWLFFDLGGVLFYFDYWTICSRMSKTSGIDPSRLYHLGFSSGLVLRFDRGEITPREFHERICSLTGASITYDNFSLMWSDIFHPNPGMFRLVNALKEKRYPLYLISNTNELHYTFLRARFPFLSLFEGATLSYQVGRLKPDEEMFRLALAQTKASPEESLYLDDIEANAAAACALGMHGLRYIHCPGVAAAFRRLGIPVQV